MKKSIFGRVVVLVVLLSFVSVIAFAGARYSNWISTRYTDVFYQEANWAGGADVEAVRWANQSSHRINVTLKFEYSKTKESVGQRELHLEGGNSYSEWVQLAPGVTFYYSVENE